MSIPQYLFRTINEQLQRADSPRRDATRPYAREDDGEITLLDVRRRTARRKCCLPFGESKRLHWLPSWRIDGRPGRNKAIDGI